MAAVASGSSSVVAVLGPGEAVHRDDLHGAAPGLGAGGEPGPEDLLGAGLDPVEQACRAGALADRGQVGHHGHEVVAAAGVAPHPTTARAPEAAHPGRQRRGSPPQRLMRQPAHHRCPCGALRAAPAAERCFLAGNDPPLQRRPAGLQALPDHDQAELVQAAEHGQIRAVEGSAAHVEVLWTGWCQSPRHQGTPTQLPTRSRHCCHTLSSDEPTMTSPGALVLVHSAPPRALGRESVNTVRARGRSRHRPGPGRGDRLTSAVRGTARAGVDRSPGDPAKVACRRRTGLIRPAAPHPPEEPQARPWIRSGARLLPVTRSGVVPC